MTARCFEYLLDVKMSSTLISIISIALSTTYYAQVDDMASNRNKTPPSHKTGNCHISSIDVFFFFVYIAIGMATLPKKTLLGPTAYLVSLKYLLS